MLSSNIPLQSRQYSMRIPDTISGGPDRTYSSALQNIDLLRGLALQRVEAAIARMEKSRNAEAYEIVFLDGIEVREGAPYIVVRAHFHLRSVRQRPVLKIIPVLES